MKKRILLFWCIIFNVFVYGQTLVTPTQSNYLCDDDLDGLVEFDLTAIGLEISVGNPDLQIEHYLSETDAINSTNPLPNNYTNVVNHQTIYVRAVNLTTGLIQLTSYGLHVIAPPPNPTVTITNCSDVTNSFPCWNLTLANPDIIGVEPGQFLITYYTTQQNALNNLNQIANPGCYISPVATPNQPPVYYRIESEDGCVAIGIIILAIEICQNPNCASPNNLTISNIDQFDAVLSWNSSGQPLSWEFIVKLQSAAPPLDTDNGEVIDSNPLYLIGLNCNTSYKVYLRAICDNNEVSGWSSSSSFTTLSCIAGPNQPYQIVECIGNGQACFDLTENNPIITANLNPADFQITYHLSQSDANSNVNALLSPYCITTNIAVNQTIYSRIKNVISNEVYIYSFVIYAQQITGNVIELDYIIACDEDQNGTILLNLTQITNQINTTNTLEYYSELNQAFNQQSTIANPSAYSITAFAANQRFYVREIINSDCDKVYFFDVLVYQNCDISFHCEYSNPICTALSTPIENIHSNMDAKLGNDYGCLGFYAKNPKWFYIPVSSNGTVRLKIEQNTSNNFSANPIDVDYIVYGPFTDPLTPCETVFEYSDIVSCGASLSAVEYPTITNAIAGQYYIMMVSNASNQLGYFKITEMPTSTATINCSGLRLNAFLDLNNNTTKDVGEPNFALGQFTKEKNNDGNVHTIVAPSGVYNIYDSNPSNSYDVTFAVDSNYAASYSVNPSSYSNISVIVGGGMQLYNFPVTVVQPYNDLAVHIIPINAPRPGFSYQNEIRFTNNGNQTISSGTITFTNDGLVTITNTNPATTLNSSGFTYTFSNLQPFETRSIMVLMQVPTIPTVALGGLLTNSASIMPTAGDVMPSNNTATNSQIIIGSYDPNDKMESHGEKILHSSFTQNDYLYYTIRFENTGTASAINVRVTDVLDEKLDETSLRMISSSHNYVLDRLDNGLVWNFDNIQLPPSVANTQIGHGYITFRIKPKSGYAIGDVILNTASIYFDFNPPIITNTFRTEFVTTLGVGEFENNDFVFYPNPASSEVTVSLKNEGSISVITLYDIVGKSIVTKKPNTTVSTQTIDVSTISKGIYLLEVTTDSNLKVIKKLIIK